MSEKMSGRHVTEGPIAPVLFSFALPVLLLQLLQELYNITDCMVVGHFGGEYALAATGVAGLVLSILIIFFIGFSSGVSGVASRLFGAYDYRELKRTVNALFRLVAAAGLGLTALGLAVAEPVLSLMRSPSEIVPHAALYLRMQALFMSISSFLIQASINHFGPAAIAGMTLFAKLEGVIYLPSFAYGIAITSFVGQNLGAGKISRIRQTVRLSLGIMTAIIIPLSLVLSLASPLLLRLFTKDQAILFNAREAVVCTLPFYVIYGLNQVLLGAIKGLGNTTWPMICTLVCYSLFRVLWCRLLIPVHPTMRVVYSSYVVSFFLMLAMLVPMCRRLCRSGAAGAQRP